jgi:hypothetical protein
MPGFANTGTNRDQTHARGLSRQGLKPDETSDESLTAPRGPV